ncbi:hypothetical protein [Lysinibacillus sp. SGAir0095]|uniref:hypothetical protein n=1 Tax=Lysinibacillus sp. SGAir0095 TaxID=2070463 RepID=UPI0010CCC102|nr:hypothetical protein [Lysinibacillus sp. SGAir0095]QCR33580.1 hypothetical protein C1N55_16090 [Lysinibacillus sp. SGAir0095]
MEEKLKKLLKKEGVSNPENPTKSDMEKIIKFDLDKTMIQEYYKYLTGLLPNMLVTINDLASKNLGKDAINSFNKRIDTLNKRYETEKDIEVLKMIQKEISDIYDRIEKESDKQRGWLLNLAYGAIGGAVILGGVGIGLKNTEAGKKVAEEGIKLLGINKNMIDKRP